MRDLLDRIDFQKGGGLVPVVVQDAVSGEILMLGYADRRAVELTMETGLAHFYSRSRRRLWMKGETSGNTLRVVDLTADCDYDAIFYLAVPAGNTCHTGKWSCFHNYVWDGPLMDALWDLLRGSLAGGARPSPLMDCTPPPDPLLISLSATVLLRGYDRRVADAAVVAGGCPSIGIVMAQRLGLRAYHAEAAREGARERRLALLGGMYDESVRALLEELEKDHEVKLAAFVVAGIGVPGAERVRRIADLGNEGGRRILRDVRGGRSAEI
ncbi:MAG: phosphoribosyl-AMP cyclohydrolase [Conexivisphaera sp.]